MLNINTNVASLTAQRNLSGSQSALSTSLQRLSSGLRINSAKDDAAGLAISERFSSQIRGTNQAVRNANDGISLAQTAEGALSEVANNLQRIRELAVQSANGTNSASDRDALDSEVKQRIAEIERVANQTNFNGLRVLDGTFGAQAFQIGANAGETISVNLAQGVKTTQIGQTATGTSTVATGVSTAALTGTGTIQVGSGSAITVGVSTAGISAGQTASSAYAKAQAINAAGVGGLTVTASTNVEFTLAATAGTAVGDAYSLKINNQDIFAGYDQNANGVLTAQQITDAINAQSTNTGVTATLTGGNLRLSAADGRNIDIGQTLGGAATGGLTAGAGGATTVNGVTYNDGVLTATAAAATGSAATANRGTVTLSANENINIVGDGAILGFAAANTTIAKDTKTLSQVSVNTVANANDAIRRLDSALQSVNSIRANLGAVQNRFASTISTLQTSSENMSASRSRIQDADFAAETAQLSRNQVLQQAGTAMLAQANSLPQNVLQLLRG